MWNPQPLKAEMVKNGLTQGDMAKKLGMSANTFSIKLKNGTFGLDEAYKMIQILSIAKPGEIFFAMQ